MRYPKLIAAFIAVGLVSIAANSQLVIFDSGSPNAICNGSVSKSPMVDGSFTLNRLGFITGSLSAANSKRWTATGFEIFQTSTFDTVSFDCFESGTPALTFGWQIYNDNAGLPGGAVAGAGETGRSTGDLFLSASYLHPNGFSVDKRFSFNPKDGQGNVRTVTLQPGKYWITIYAEPDPADPALEQYFAWFIGAPNGHVGDYDARSSGTTGTFASYTGVLNRFVMFNMLADHPEAPYPGGSVFSATGMTTEGTVYSPASTQFPHSRYKASFQLSNANSIGGQIAMEIKVNNYKSGSADDARFQNWMDPAGTTVASYNLWLFPAGTSDYSHAQYCLTVSDTLGGGIYTTPDVLPGTYDVVVQPYYDTIGYPGAADAAALWRPIAPPWLATKVSGVVVTAGNVTNASVTLPNGDVNCDGVVDDADITLVVLHFGEDAATAAAAAGVGRDFWRYSWDATGDQAVDDADLTAVIIDYGNEAVKAGR